MPEPHSITRKDRHESSLPQSWQPFESLRRDIDRLFDDRSSAGFWRAPFPQVCRRSHALLGPRNDLCHGSGGRY